MGAGSEVTGDNTIGLGNNTVVDGTGSTAVGSGSEVTGDNSVALGSGTSVSGNSGLAIGSDSVVSGSDGSAIGSSSVSSGDGASAVGHGAIAEGDSSVALGENSVAKDDNVISLGHTATDTDVQGQAYGSDLTRRIVNVADGTSATDAATVGQIREYVNGTHTTMTANGKNALGQDRYVFDVNVDGEIASGNTGLVTGGAIFEAIKNIGSGSTGDGTSGSTAIGDGSSTTNDNSVAVGGNSTASGENTVAVGTGSTVEGQNSTAVGTNSGVTGDNAIGLGDSSVALGENSVANDVDVVSVGHKATDTDASGNAYGSDLTRKITNVTSGTVAEGSTDVVTGGQLFETNKAIEELRGSIGDVANLDLDGLIEEIGKGAVAEGDTSLVTGGTLYNEVRPASDGRFVKADKTVGENMAILDRMVSESTNGVLYVGVNAVEDDQDTMHGGAVGDYSTTLGVGAKAEGSEGIAIGHGSKANGTQSIAIGTGNEVTGNHSGAFGDPNIVTGDESYVMGNNNTISGNNSFVLSNNATVTGNNSVVLGNGSDGSMDNVVSVGSAGAERKIVHVANGDVTPDSKDVVNGGQLYQVQKDLREAKDIDTAKWAEKLGTGEVAEGDDNLVTGGTVYNAIKGMEVIAPDLANNELHIGGTAAYDGVNTINVAKSDGSGRVITGIATDPNDASSAANVGYVNAVGQNIINGVNDGFSKVNDKVGKAGASAAAMASLQAPPMDGDEKWAFSAAVGHYDGKTAGAVGAFYRPQDNVLINVRGAVGNGEDMIGAGVGISLERGNTPHVSKAQLVRTINAQAGKVVC